MGHWLSKRLSLLPPLLFLMFNESIVFSPSDVNTPPIVLLFSFKNVSRVLSRRGLYRKETGREHISPLLHRLPSCSARLTSSPPLTSHERHGGSAESQDQRAVLNSRNHHLAKLLRAAAASSRRGRNARPPEARQ